VYQKRATQIYQIDVEGGTGWHVIVEGSNAGKFGIVF
jgi:hypothetical protein